MKTAFTVIQVITLILIIATVLLQQKGTGLSSMFGSSTNFYQTKRGAEKLLFYTTVVSAIIFLIVTQYFSVLKTTRGQASSKKWISNQN
jgi:protein translocase SecG subunit